MFCLCFALAQHICSCTLSFHHAMQSSYWWMLRHLTWAVWALSWGSPNPRALQQSSPWSSWKQWTWVRFNRTVAWSASGVEANGLWAACRRTWLVQFVMLLTASTFVIPGKELCLPLKKQKKNRLHALWASWKMHILCRPAWLKIFLYTGSAPRFQVLKVHEDMLCFQEGLFFTT